MANKHHKKQKQILRAVAEPEIHSRNEHYGLRMFV